MKILHLIAFLAALENFVFGMNDNENRLPQRQIDNYVREETLQYYKVIEAINELTPEFERMYDRIKSIEEDVRILKDVDNNLEKITFGAKVSVIALSSLFPVVPHPILLHGISLFLSTLVGLDNNAVKSAITKKIESYNSDYAQYVKNYYVLMPEILKSRLSLSDTKINEIVYEIRQRIE